MKLELKDYVNEHTILIVRFFFFLFFPLYNDFTKMEVSLSCLKKKKMLFQQLFNRNSSVLSLF